MKKIFTWLFVFSALSLLVRPALAVEFHSRENVVIPKGIVSDGSVIAAGNLVRIEGRVDGDLFCVAKSVKINGEVTGDVICAAQDLSIGGTVLGSVRSVSQRLDIDGQISRSVSSFAQQVIQGTQAEVAGELLLAGQSVILAGQVGRQSYVLGEQLTLNGKFAQSVWAQTKTLEIGSAATIAGDLVYASDQPARIDGQASITGATRRQDMKKATPTVTQSRSWLHDRLTGWLMAWGLGLLLLVIFPVLLEKASSLSQADVLSNLGAGILFIVMTPVVIIILLASVVGLPVGLLLLAVFAAFLVLSRVVVAVDLGKLVLAKLGFAGGKSPVWQLFVGVVLLWTIFGLPVIGGLVSLMSLLLGLGGLMRVLLAVIRPARKKKH